MATNAPNTFDQAPVVAEVRPGPTIPIEPGKGDTDAYGSKDLDASERSQLAEEKAKLGPALSRFAPFQDQVMHFPDSALFENIITTPASLRPMVATLYPQHSYFIPNSNLMYALLNVIDTKMTDTHKWKQNNPSWNPLISRIYLGVLYLVQTMRAMKRANALSPQMSQQLRHFEELFSFNTLWIPGPLVQYFRVLSAFKPVTGVVCGNVSPALPHIPGWTAADLFALNPAIRRQLPNIPAMMEQLQFIVDAHAAVPIGIPAWNTFARSITELFTVNAENNVLWQSVINSPGLQYTLPGSQELWIRSLDRATTLLLPPRLTAVAPAVLNDDWFAFMRFSATENEYTWFGQFSTIMALYSQFFSDSVTLDDCDPSKSAAGTFKMFQTAGTTIDNDCAFAPGTHALSLKVHNTITMSGSHCIQDLPAFFEYQALVTGVNCLPRNTADIGLREGPFWAISPDVRECVNVSPLPNLQTVAIRDFYSDTKLKPDQQFSR